MQSVRHSSAFGFGPSDPMSLPISGAAALRGIGRPTLQTSTGPAAGAVTVPTAPVVAPVARRIVARLAAA